MTQHQTITAYFAADHDRLDSLLNQYSQIKHKDVAAAKPFFRAFFKGLKKHIVWEEDVLFPFFEQATGIQSGPTEVMRYEHRQIGEIINRFHEKVRNADSNTDPEEQDLLAILKPHNDKEENILYPAIDQHATVEDAATLFLAMESIPAERYDHCCHHHPVA